MKLNYHNKQQFLASVRKLAAGKKVSAQIMLQEVVLDEILDRIAHSRYRDNLVLKGGFLIASLLGVDTRSTRDIDTSVTGMDLERGQIDSVFQEICQIALPDDDIKLRMIKIEKIRQDAEYIGYRIHIRAFIYSSVVDAKVDISTGDVITERAIKYGHQLLLEKRTIQIMAYNAETIVAEKLQTIVNRGEFNTRLKDFYDLYQFENEATIKLNYDLLKKAVIATANNRNDRQSLGDYGNRLETLSSSEVLAARWFRYQSENTYAEGITFKATCTAAMELVKRAHIDDP